MPSTPRILEQLPSLYRPEPGYDGGDLLLLMAEAVGDLLDQLSSDSAEVMQVHWFDYADSAIYSSWVGRRRTLGGEGPLTLDDPTIDRHPYLLDLPRIAALMDLAPWREPLRDRERVEAFRERVRRIVRLHRDGLGTVRALRNMTMAALPQIDPDAPQGLRERSFTIEEFSGAGQRLHEVQQKGIPDKQVGPLMRWQIDSKSLAPVTPMVIIEGVTPQSGLIEPTSRPVIEHFDPASGTGIGILYQGDLAPGQALALVPGYLSWLGRADGLDSAASLPAGIEPVNPTAAGPWSATAGVPGGRVVDLAQSADQALWAAINGADGSLWRYDGTSWTEILSGLPQLHCLLAQGRQLLIGCEVGLVTLDTAPEGPYVLDPDPTGLGDPAVHALVIDPQGQLWAATVQGLAREQSGVLVYTGLGNRSDTETPLYCLRIDRSGELYCGGELGLFLYRPASQRCYILQGEGVDEAVDDWLELDLTTDTLPAANGLPLPPVHAVMRGPATDIWLGTAQGIARYRAREQRRAYTTLLEAMPQLTESAVNRIALDARQRLWFTTGEGLFVYDQLDWWQRQGDELVRLPRQPEDPDRPVFWRYQRSGSQWQSLAPPSTTGFQNHGLAQIGSSEPALHAVAWTEIAQAWLGSFDGTSFTLDEGASPAALASRYKPQATRIVDGGIAAVPHLPSGVSHWRYLQREEATPPTPSAFPAWTREGRLLPPPDKEPAPFEGRYLRPKQEAPDNNVFAYNPAARVWFGWQPRASLAVTVRLARSAPDESIDPQILDRVWNELQRVKPAAVAVYLAVDETIERGE